jgi:hypothetical protein
MRLFGFVGLVTLAAGAVGAAGCEDAKSPAVNDDIGWHVGCAQGSSGCTLFPGRAQELMSPTNKRDFDVKCSIDGDNVSFTIKDPGLDPAKSPPGIAAGTISVQNGNAKNNACNVTVTDAMEAGFSPILFRGNCQSSGDTGSCTLTRLADMEGWQWVGTLRCDRLVRDNMNMPVYNLTGLNSGEPVTIALANCD